MAETWSAEAEFTAAGILRRTLVLIQANGLRVAIAMAAMMVPGVMLDMGIGDEGLNFVLTFVTLAMQYWLTAALLQDLGLRSSTRARFPAFFLLGIVTTLGILAGLLLLVIPGIILMVRWSIAVPIVVAADEGVIDAIGSSWRETEGRFWPIFAVFLVLYVPVLIGMAGTYVLYEQASQGLGATILFELALNGGLIAGWHGAIAIYAGTRRGVGVTEVFA